MNSIRPAGSDDAEAVLRLFDDAIAWFVAIGNTGQWGAEPFSSQPKQVDRVRGWVAEPGSWVAEHPDAGVVGFLALGEATDYVPAATQAEVYVRVLIGSRDARAKGTGRQLLGFADEQARAAGADLLRVDCYAGGTGDLIRFYESCGYHPTTTFTVGAWPGQVLERVVERGVERGVGEPGDGRA
ncbi:GNAT family N-acetyltransferase [Leifsonia shinshuensis]|uniref:GNAT family N-acetyltransferase n=1 Tax=Leifsonia shinshuensis TaxID=150026 RepID=UPI001F5088C1|nr:GNAT family N-acetyltransferase [Leifsonia shinshuensis]MCI0157418.1 GNAT family N-acetyltransferase [Leifsonia shinshuensis]